MTDSIVGRKLAQLIQLRGWTYGQVEHRSGVSANYIGKLVNGQRRDPGFTVVMALAEAFGVSLDWFADHDQTAVSSALSADERELLELYRAMNDPDLRLITLEEVRLHADYHHKRRG